MKREEDELTKMVVLSQKETRIKGDFYVQVENDMKTLDIQENMITTTHKNTLKEVLNNKLHSCAFQYLITLAHTHSKVHNESYSDLKGMPYMNDNRFTPDLVNLLFKFRTRMYNVKNNFRNNYKQTNILFPSVQSPR